MSKCVLKVTPREGVYISRCSILWQQENEVFLRQEELIQIHSELRLIAKTAWMQFPGLQAAPTEHSKALCE